MPDLGSYAVAVLSSYAVTLALLAVLVWTSVRRFRRVRAELEMLEGTATRDG